MLDRDIGLVRPNPEDAADVPATRVARVEREGAVCQPYQGADVLAEMAQGKGGIRQDAWIVAGHFQGSPGEIDALQTVCRRILAPAAHFVGRRFAEAVPKLLLAIQEDPSFPTPYRFLAACYAHMGRRDDAREFIRRLRAITPVVIPDASFLRSPEHRELILSGLRLAAGEAR